MISVDIQCLQVLSCGSCLQSRAWNACCNNCAKSCFFEALEVSRHMLGGQIVVITQCPVRPNARLIESVVVAAQLPHHAYHGWLFVLK
jgi:hypothetical protein